MSFFSVIIPVFNRYTLIERAIHSVFSQTYCDYEFIIVNDGSTDGTCELLETYKNKIKVIETKNMGVSAARNVGIRESTGDHIVFLDSDDEWLPSKLEKQREFILKNNYRVHQTDESWIRNGNWHNPMKKHTKKGGDFFKESLSLCLVSPSAVSLDRGIFNDFGLFDEKMRVCEDYDLWLRILSFEEIGFLNEKLVVKHGGHSDQLSSSTWGLDRFRVYSMMKLFVSNKSFSNEKRELVKTEIMKKITILKKGAIKRENQTLLDGLFIIEHFLIDNSSSIDFSFLLQE